MEQQTEQKELFKCWKCLREFEDTDDLNIEYDEYTGEWICGDCREQNFRDKYEIITDTHNNEETALNVENYPYGFRLRTTIRYYIETTKHGDRFVSQTLNPKTNKWNTPKKSTYTAVEVLVREKATGYIRTRGLHFSTDRKEILRFCDFIKDYKLSKEQENQLRLLKAYSKAYENVEFEIKPHRETDELTELLEKKEQQEAKKNIEKAIGYYYHTQEF